MSKFASWLALAFYGVGAAQGGVVVHMSSRSLPSGPPKADQVLYAQDGQLRVDKLDGQGHVRETTLLRDGAIWSIDVAAHTFRITKKGDIVAEHGATEAKLQAYLQSLPPEKRAMFEQRMAALKQKTHDYALKDSGRTEHVGAYKCEVWQATRDGKVFTENCVAPQSSLPDGSELVTAAHNAAKIANDVISAVPEATRVINPMYGLYGKMSGFPILVRYMSDTRADREEAVTGIEKQSLSADKFEVPKGYREQAVAGAPIAH